MQRGSPNVSLFVVAARTKKIAPGKFLAVKIRSFGNLGAFVSFRGAMPPAVNIGTVCGVYLTPALHVAISGMLTNTHCTSPYRGARKA
jgi:carbon-monoxide dehydrogenase large subunit